MRQQFFSDILVVASALQLIYLPLVAAKAVFLNDRASRNNNPPYSGLFESIQTQEALSHLNELQRIASVNNGTRAVNTRGFNGTLDYIMNYLTANTNFKIQKTFFPVRDFVLANNPIFLSSIGGKIFNYTYSKNRSSAEFVEVEYSARADFTNFVQLTVVPNAGCSDADWSAATSSVAGRVALVKRGDCSFVDKSKLAVKFNASAVLFYNDGTSSNRMSPTSIELEQANAIPALSLSYQLGSSLVNAARNSPTQATVRMTIAVADNDPFPVGNICADTLTGDPTQTIVVGSHSDGVPAGPGINDDGSGSAAVLAIATSLARLFRTFTYAKYKYRIRFCWWGAEEMGLLGSEHHVAQALKSTVVGERLADYLLYLNFDMLGSSNFMYGIYDGRTARNNTLPLAVSGSFKISQVFRDWFIRQNLPWDFTEFGYGSDYAPFLIEGVPSGGLFSGSSDIKTQEQRDRYEKLLGQGLGGIAGVAHDPCYHKACDTIQNINVLGYENMIRAAAYVIENLAQKPDLKFWLTKDGSA